MAASDNLKKAVLYAKSQCGLKPFFQAMPDEEIIYYLDHLADTEGENTPPGEAEKKVIENESDSNREQAPDF